MYTNPKYVTVQKFSELTGLPVKTVRLACKDGRLTWVPFGKRKLIDIQAYEKRLDDYLANIQIMARDIVRKAGLNPFKGVTQKRGS